LQPEEGAVCKTGGTMPMQQDKSMEVCIGLELGTLLQVEIEGVGSAKTSIIGIVRGKGLIIRPPALVGIETRLFKKNQTVVRYFHEGMIFGFRCTIIGLIKTPFPLLILSYPEGSEQLNLRRHKRLSCRLNGQLLMDSLTPKIVVLDISPSGCRLAVPEPAGLDISQLGMDSNITLTLDMDKEIQETVTFVARVKNLQTDGNGLTIGVEFNKEIDQTDSHSLEKLKRYIDVVNESLSFD
jgi:c-di-GMP-binding flagellar brake protein YcgR